MQFNWSTTLYSLCWKNLKNHMLLQRLSLSFLFPHLQHCFAHFFSFMNDLSFSIAISSLICSWLFSPLKSEGVKRRPLLVIPQIPEILSTATLPWSADSSFSSPWMILTPYFQGTTLLFLYGKDNGVWITNGYDFEGMGLAVAFENCMTTGLGRGVLLLSPAIALPLSSIMSYWFEFYKDVTEYFNFISQYHYFIKCKCNLINLKQ